MNEPQRYSENDLGFFKDLISNQVGHFKKQALKEKLLKIFIISFVGLYWCSIAVSGMAFIWTFEIVFLKIFGCLFILGIFLMALFATLNVVVGY